MMKQLPWTKTPVLVALVLAIASPALAQSAGDATAEARLRKDGTRFVDADDEGSSSIAYRELLNADGSPSTTVSAGYVWAPGTELSVATGKAA